MIRISLLIVPAILLILGSCEKSENKDVKSSKDSVVVQTSVEESKAEFSSLVTGNWYNPKMDCKDGFGLCRVEFTKPNDDVVVLDSISSGGKDASIPAFFKISANNEEELTILFMEKCPNWEEEFVVDTLSIPYSDMVEGFTIVPVPGEYQTEKDLGDFGGVKIEVDLVAN